MPMKRPLDSIGKGYNSAHLRSARVGTDGRMVQCEQPRIPRLTALWLLSTRTYLLRICPTNPPPASRPPQHCPPPTPPTANSPPPFFYFMDVKCCIEGYMRNWGKVDLMLFASHRTRPQVRAPAIMRPLLPVLQPGRVQPGSRSQGIGRISTAWPACRRPPPPPPPRRSVETSQAGGL